MEFTSPGVPQVGSVIPGKEPVSSVSFHNDGMHLFVASETGQKLRIVDCQAGSSEQPPIKFEREGISLVEST